MKLRTTALAAAVTLATSNLAFAEGEAPLPGHPGDTSPPTASAASVDPFSLSVPLLDREDPTPSYAQPAPRPSSNPAAPAGTSMEGMDHSAMPGMTH
jgi:hypothetical protein